MVILAIFCDTNENFLGTNIMIDHVSKTAHVVTQIQYGCQVILIFSFILLDSKLIHINYNTHISKRNPFNENAAMHVIAIV